jgi:hypothetical protein
MVSGLGVGLRADAVFLGKRVNPPLVGGGIHVAY